MDDKPRSIDEHIQLLQQRGMIFSDVNKARERFERISYSRMKYYWRDLIDSSPKGDFVKDASFDDVIARYDFDRQLRVILFDAIEIIEVALRSKIINHMSQYAGNGLWYLDTSLFERKDYHKNFVLDLKKEFSISNEPFAREYIDEHPNWNKTSFEGDNPNAWMIIEVATFGALSKMYKNLKSQLPQRATIANDFGLYSAKDFSSWIEAISHLRNVIAHHSRLWNRTLGKKVTNLKGHKYKWLNTPLVETQKNKPYGIIVAMLYLCNAVYPNNGIKERLLELIDTNVDVPIQKIGFYGRWQDEPLWQP